MSIVTDIILVTAIDDGGGDGEHPNVDALNKSLAEIGGRLPHLVQVDGYARSGKAMQCDIFVAAVNYLDEAALLAGLQAVPWEMPDCVQLMLKRDQEERFTVYQLDWQEGENLLSKLDPSMAIPP